MDKNNIETIDNKKNEFLIYTSTDGTCKIQVRLVDENVWLTQDLMSRLFSTTSQNITMHIKNIYEEMELEDKSTCKDFLQVQKEGGRSITRILKHYNLDVIISVGYRVKSIRGTQFRQWATQRLKEYLIKGFTINKEYLKDPEGKDYFEELLKEIREIRASEKRFYSKILDIYATSTDYNRTSDITKDFFATVQNKLFFAITGKTAAEIIDCRADANELNMGLTSWESKNIRTSDITIAKNYLNKDELDKLERFTIMYLDYAELQALNRKPMTMLEWVKKLDELLKFNEFKILLDNGSISKELADKKAKKELQKFNDKRKEFEEIEEDKKFVEHIEELKKIKDLNKKIELSDFNKKLKKGLEYTEK